MEEKEKGIRSVERALMILDCYKPSRKDLSLTEISKRIELSPSTTSRLLETLEQKHYIYRDPENRRYYLGYRLAQISNIAFENSEPGQIAMPELKKLNEQFDESVGVYVIKGDRRVCIARMESSRQMRIVSPLGGIQPLTRGASGRMILAWQSEEMIDRLLKEDPFTTKEALAEIRQKGYAVSMDEREEGVVSIAAPIFNAKGEGVGTIFISAASFRTNFSAIESMIGAVCDAAKTVSKSMGFSKDSPRG